MFFNVLIGGEAGQGMETISTLLEKILKKQGFEIFSTKDYMSRVRGGHNFTQVRFGDERITAHWDELDGIIALNGQTVDIHAKRLKKKGFLLCDKELETDHKGVMRLPLKAAAKSIGNPRVSGSVALGAVLRLFNLELTHVLASVREVFDQKDIREKNMEAFKAGFAMAKPVYAIKKPARNEGILVNGGQAIAMGALAAGCRFYSAYPMTPSTGVMNHLAEKMEQAKMVVEQAEDEIAAINMAIGASYAGVRAMTGTSGGGFSLMVEALGLSGMMEIPLVVLNMQRPGPVTGFPTRTEQADLKFVISASQGEFPRAVIALRNPSDAFYQTVRAFHLADKYQIPVILLGDQYLADSSATVDSFDLDNIQIDRFLCQTLEKPGEYRRYEMTKTGISPRVIPGKIPGTRVVVDSDEHDQHGHITEDANMKVLMTDKRMKKLEALSREMQEPAYVGAENPETLLLAWGSLDGPIREAVEILNRGKERVGALVFGDIWPFPDTLLMEKAGMAKRIVNVEQNATGQLASLVRERTGIRCDACVLKYDGRPLSPMEIADELKGGRG
ncbi:MAG: 2-oxoacid:acceptor oxidoreductase subunit alpha [Clostridia bacterium]